MRRSMISVVVPVHDEEESISRLHEGLSKVADSNLA